MGFRVYGLGLGFRVSGWGLRGLEFRVEGSDDDDADADDTFEDNDYVISGPQ